MTNPTTPFGWQMPTSTDLVTDLPADFETFGQAVATSMADLLGGTTGQILSKASNTNMDFTWITNDVGDITAVTAGTGISGGGTSGAVTITNSMATEIAAKGDLIVGTGAATFDNLTAGANGRALVADSTAATGLAYSANAPLGGLTLLGTVNLTGANTITISGISNKSRLALFVENASTVTGGSYVGVRFNGQAANYGFGGLQIVGGVVSSGFNTSSDRIYTAQQGNSATDTFQFIMHASGTFGAGMIQTATGCQSNGTNAAAYNFQGFSIQSGQVTSVSIVANDNFDAGTFALYGA